MSLLKRTPDRHIAEEVLRFLIQALSEKIIKISITYSCEIFMDI